MGEFTLPISSTFVSTEKFITGMLTCGGCLLTLRSGLLNCRFAYLWVCLPHGIVGLVDLTSTK